MRTRPLLHTQDRRRLNTRRTRRTPALSQRTINRNSRRQMTLLYTRRHRTSSNITTNHLRSNLTQDRNTTTLHILSSTSHRPVLRQKRQIRRLNLSMSNSPISASIISPRHEHIASDLRGTLMRSPSPLHHSNHHQYRRSSLHQTHSNSPYKIRVCQLRSQGSMDDLTRPEP